MKISEFSATGGLISDFEFKSKDMKSQRKTFCIFILVVITSNICLAQPRRRYQVKIQLTDYLKFKSNHYFYGDLIRVNKINSTERTILHQIRQGDYPDNGLNLDVRLHNNENLELRFYLVSKNGNDRIETFHKIYSTIELESEDTIFFEIPTSEWESSSLTTKDFIKFIKSTIFSREQKALTNSSLYSELSSLPLGAYVFVDKTTGNIEKLELQEFDTLSFNETIPKDQIFLKYNKIIRKEDNGSIDASFNKAGIFASISSIIQNSDFVEISMSLDSYYKKYIKNVGAIQTKYLTSDPTTLHPWFQDKIERINSSNNIYELHFTTGYKLIDKLDLNYNSYKKFESENNIDLQLYEVVTAEAGAKFTRFRSTKDTTLIKDYLVDVETENLTESLYNLAGFYQQSESEESIKSNRQNKLKAAELRLEDEIKIFKPNYNNFLKIYQPQTIGGLISFLELNCDINDCLAEAVGVFNDLQTDDFSGTITSEHQFFLLSKFSNISNKEIVDRAILLNSNLLKTKLDFLISVANEASAIQGTVILLKSQLESDSPISYTDFLKKYYKDNNLGRANGPVPGYFLPSEIN